MRLATWPDLLAAYIAEQASVPFTWGTNDCVTFAAEWVRRCTGQAVFAASYDSEFGALRLLAGKGLQDAITEVLGEPMAYPAAAGRGDVALVNLAVPTTAVVDGEHAFAPGPTGLVAFPRSEIFMAWSV